MWRPFRRREVSPLDPAQRVKLRAALQAGASPQIGPLDAEGFALKVESIDAVMRNVTFDVWALEMAFAKEMIGKLFLHRRTMKQYVVKAVMRGKIPYRFRWGNIRHILRNDRRWAVGVVYENVVDPVEPFWRSLGDFRASFTRAPDER